MEWWLNSTRFACNFSVAQSVALQLSSFAWRRIITWLQSCSETISVVCWIVKHSPMIHSIGFGFGGFAFLVVWNCTFLVKIDSGYGGSWSACAGWREGRIFLTYHLIGCHPGYDMFEKTTSNAERAVQPVRWFWLHHVASLQSNPFHVGAGIINFFAKVSRRSSSRCAFQALVITSRRDSRGILWLGRALCVNSTWCSVEEFGHAAASLRRVRWSSDFSCMVRYLVYLVGSFAFLRGITTFHRASLRRIL